MINWSRIAAQVGQAFTRASCASIGFCRPALPAANAFSPVRAFILPASSGTIEAFDNRREDAALKAVELRYVKIAACDLTVTPATGDLLQFAGKNWYVLGCTPVDPAASVPLVFGLGVHAL